MARAAQRIKGTTHIKVKTSSNATKARVKSNGGNQKRCPACGRYM